MKTIEDEMLICIGKQCYDNFRLKSYYKDKIKELDNTIEELREQVKMQDKAISSLHNFAEGKTKTREELGL